MNVVREVGDVDVYGDLDGNDEEEEEEEEDDDDDYYDGCVFIDD